jgi:hypothetical protein
VANWAFIRSFLMFGGQFIFCYLIIGEKEKEMNDEGRMKKEEKKERRKGKERRRKKRKQRKKKKDEKEEKQEKKIKKETNFFYQPVKKWAVAEHTLRAGLKIRLVGPIFSSTHRPLQGSSS